MKRDIKVKERLVEYWDIDTGIYENEIVKYLDKIVEDMDLSKYIL